MGIKNEPIKYCDFQQRNLRIKHGGKIYTCIICGKDFCEKCKVAFEGEICGECLFDRGLNNIETKFYIAKIKLEEKRKSSLKRYGRKLRRALKRKTLDLKDDKLCDGCHFLYYNTKYDDLQCRLGYFDYYKYSPKKVKDQRKIYRPSKCIENQKVRGKK